MFVFLCESVSLRFSLSLPVLFVLPTSDATAIIISSSVVLFLKSGGATCLRVQASNLSHSQTCASFMSILTGNLEAASWGLKVCSNSLCSILYRATQQDGYKPEGVCFARLDAALCLVPLRSVLSSCLLANAHSLTLSAD